MQISDSSSVSLASLASAQSGNAVQSEIATAVLRQIMDGQARQAQALLEMIARTPSPEGVGKQIDLRA